MARDPVLTDLPWSLEFRATTAGFTIDARFDAASGRLELVLTSTAGRARSIRSVAVEAALDLPAPSGFARLNSAQSDGNDVVREFGSARAVGRAAVRCRSEGWIIVVCPARAFPALVIGALDASSDAPEFVIELDPGETVMRTLAVTAHFPERRVRPGDQVVLPLYVAEGLDIDHMAAAYAGALVAGGLAPDLPAGALHGIAVVRDEADTQSRGGTVAGGIKALRVAPLSIPSGTDIARDHPSWVLEDAEHRPMLNVVTADARDWTAERVSSALAASGCTALDLVGLSTTTSDPGSAAAARLVLDAIRHAAGEGVVILAHDVALAAASGVVDAVVAAPLGAATDDRSVASAAQTALLRGVIHERWWNAAIEMPATVAALSDAAWRTAMTAIALSGFVPVLPPGIDQLPAARRLAIEAVLPATGIPADPLTPVPVDGISAWSVTLPGERVLLGVFNWSDGPRWVSPGEYLRPGEIAFDFWNARLLGMGDILLRPCDAALWQVAGQGRGGHLIGDAGNVTSATLFQRSVSGRLQLGNDLDRPRVVAVHARGESYLVTLQPGERRWFD